MLKQSIHYLRRSRTSLDDYRIKRGVINEPVLEERMETFYANAFTIGIADGNVLMVFELHVQGREVAEKVIVMSPNGFKTLIKSAEKEIEAFEKEQGRVEEWNLPPEEKGLLAI